MGFTAGESMDSIAIQVDRMDDRTDSEAFDSDASTQHLMRKLMKLMPQLLWVCNSCCKSLLEMNIHK